MSTTITIEVPVTFPPVGRYGRKELPSGTDQPSLPPGRVPRVSRLMALALRLDELVRTGQVASYSALAALGQVTRARISQIVSLLQLAPDIQEALLFLPLPVRKGTPRLSRRPNRTGKLPRDCQKIKLNKTELVDFSWVSSPSLLYAGSVRGMTPRKCSRGLI